MSRFQKSLLIEPRRTWQVNLFLSAIVAFLLILVFQKCTTHDGSARILVFNKAEGYFHESTEAGIEALRQLCRDNNIKMDVTDDGEKLTENNLRKYSAVVFLNTAGDVLDPLQEKAFERYIHAGGGFVGIHTAIDTEHNWNWYEKLIGAHFESQSDVEQGTLKVEDHNHPASTFLQDSLIRNDEWFNLKDISPAIHVLLSKEGNSYEGGVVGSLHPVSWYQEFEGGRVFVTAMGHTSESYKDENFLRHLLGGVQYAIGENKQSGNGNLYVEADTSIKSDANGFTKSSLVCDLDEPMAMDIFPDGKIIFIERRGAIKLFDPTSGNNKVTNNLDVFIKGEEGLLGIAIDPNWQNNHWIYLYYTPRDDNEAIRLSRFVFVNDLLQPSTEKVLLKVPTLKGPSNFHAAGSIEFDANGFLYLSTGDNSSPRNDDYSVIDERKGREAFDAQKSSSNSMDLRGKILRIKPLADGSYLCPKGNLYANQDIILPPASGQQSKDPNFLKKIKGAISTNALENKTLNDSTTGTTQDLNVDHVTFPMTDPIHTSYGRPEIFVMGVRNPFRISFDNKRQTLFWGDVGPDAGMSDSLRGPEGYDEINAAHSAGFYGWPYFIGPNLPYRDYDYETKKSGTYFNPVRPVNNSPNNTGTRNLPPSRSPLIWYAFRSSKEFPLVANGTRCIMAGPAYYCDQYPVNSRFPDRYDKNLLIYDWMRNWIIAVTLDAAGNYIKMEPLAENLRLNRPIDMIIDKKGSLWILEYGIEWYAKNKEACLSRIDFVQGEAGSIAKSGTSSALAIQWDFFNKNRSFYQAGDIIPYRLKFAKSESEQLVSLNIDIQYKETSQNAWQFTKGWLRESREQKKTSQGQILIDKSDCRSCHALDRKVNGPAYLDISARYSQSSSADSLLKRKIIHGGSGNWGDRAMIAHPQLSQKDAAEMVSWILSLKDQSKKIISREGRYAFNIPASSKNKEGFYVFHSSINDGTGETIVFRPNLVQVEKADSCSNSFRRYKRTVDGMTMLINELKNKDFFMLKEIDLNGVKSVEFALETSAQQQQTGGGVLELHVDGIDGPLVGSISIPPSYSSGDAAIKRIILPVQTTASLKSNSLHDLFFLVKKENKESKPVLGIDWVRFNFK